MTYRRVAGINLCGWCKQPIKQGQTYKRDGVYGNVHAEEGECLRKVKGEITIGEPDPEVELDDERYKKDIELEEAKVRALEEIVVELRILNNKITTQFSMVTDLAIKYFKQITT